MKLDKGIPALYSVAGLLSTILLASVMLAYVYQKVTILYGHLDTNVSFSTLDDFSIIEFHIQS